VSSGKTIAILQSNYIPWKGYFDLMAAVDEFFILDEVQFTKRDWRNRNRIVSAGRVSWLTIPVRTAGHFRAPIDSIEIADPLWAKRHWSRLKTSYRESEHFRWLAPHLEGLYQRAAAISRLTEVNELFMRKLANLLDLPTRLARSNEVPRRAASATERLIEICQASDASVYVSGPSARAYIDASRFADAGIELRYVNYSGYPEYEQGTRVFDHHTSVLDTLFHCGPATRGHLTSLRDRSSFLEPH
jgi:hypothetical protein